MSFGSRLKERREAMHLSQKQLGDALGVSGNAVGNYEKGVSSPNADALYKVFELLKCDANYLFQDEMNYSQSFTAKAMLTAECYDKLDEHGKDAVDTIIAVEQKRLQNAYENKIIPLFGTSAAAGPGEIDTDLPWDDYSVPGDSKAEFAVRISGDSMEPVLHDGQIALCTKERPDVGDVAIVMINGALLVKQFITDGRNVFLRSINRDRKDCDYDIWATGNDTVQCYGTVILKKRPPLVEQ